MPTPSIKLDFPDRRRDGCPFSGYTFACDGTLADTMPLHYRAWKRRACSVCSCRG